MDLFQAIAQRRSVKHYDPNHRMTLREIDKLLSAAILAPTSFNIQNWRFVLVQDSELRQQIRAAAWNQAQCTEASLLVVICGDLKAYEKNPRRYWHTAPAEVQDFLVPAILNYYKDSPAAQHDEAMRSGGMAAQNLMLAAKAMGYDSCPMVGFDFAQVGKLINLPADHVVCMMLAIGKALQPARPRGGQLPLNEVVVQNRF